MGKTILLMLQTHTIRATRCRHFNMANSWKQSMDKAIRRFKRTPRMYMHEHINFPLSNIITYHLVNALIRPKVLMIWYNSLPLIPPKQKTYTTLPEMKQNLYLKMSSVLLCMSHTSVRIYRFPFKLYEFVKEVLLSYIVGPLFHLRMS